MVFKKNTLNRRVELNKIKWEMTMKTIIQSISFILLLSIISSFAYGKNESSYADEGEVIIHDNVDLVESKEDDKETRLDENVMKNETYNNKEKLLDKMIDIEINILMKRFKRKITNHLRILIKSEVIRLLRKELNSYSSKTVKEKVRYVIINHFKIIINHYKIRKKIRPKARYKKKYKKVLKKTRAKKRYKRIKKFVKYRLRLRIVNIKVGHDRPKLEAVGSDQMLPITITVMSRSKDRNAKLVLYAKDLKSGKSYPIYRLDKFQLNKNWAQDQVNWDGSYLVENDTKPLPSGRYAIVCVLSVQNKGKVTKIITRVWGLGHKDYYVTVK
ncbi:MAG: hypothetical protein IEMM0008_0498 [bacterium]|nr:MAG: hypothetical protein IEMM0008_0498 [bacterium]